MKIKQSIKSFCLELINIKRKRISKGNYEYCGNFENTSVNVCKKAKNFQEFSQIIKNELITKKKSGFAFYSQKEWEKGILKDKFAGSREYKKIQKENIPKTLKETISAFNFLNMTANRTNNEEDTRLVTGNNANCYRKTYKKYNIKLK